MVLRAGGGNVKGDPPGTGVVSLKALYYMDAQIFLIRNISLCEHALVSQLVQEVFEVVVDVLDVACEAQVSQ